MAMNVHFIDFNSNGNNINEYINSSSFWNWINDISRRVKSYFFIFIPELT